MNSPAGKNLFWQTVRTRWWLWAGPTVALTVLAAVYTVTKTDRWRASQALVVRDEAAGQSGRIGRFDSVDAMKTSQETILEVSRNYAVVESALRQAGPSGSKRNKPGWPTRDDVEALRAAIKVRAPKGAEFGRTEVIYLSVEDTSPQRAIVLTQSVCDQLERRLMELRRQKAESIIAELVNAVANARTNWQTATARLKEMEAQVGSDLGELRVLNDSGSGDSNLRLSLNEIKNEVRQARVAELAAQERHTFLKAARDDGGRLVAIPNRVLEAQPALRRLKDGLVDAQLRRAQLAGAFSEDHPRMKAAIAAEEEVRTRLREELNLAIRGAEADLQVIRRQIESLDTQQHEIEARLTRLASLRAEYANLVAEVNQAGQSYEKASKDLAEARAALVAASASSLIERLGPPDTGGGPIGPGDKTILLAGFGGGLLTGLGLVLLAMPGGNRRGRRWSDCLPWGRRASDEPAKAAAVAGSPAGRRASDQPVAAAGSVAADRRQRGLEPNFTAAPVANVEDFDGEVENFVAQAAATGDTLVATVEPPADAATTVSGRVEPPPITQPLAAKQVVAMLSELDEAT